MSQQFPAFHENNNSYNNKTTMIKEILVIFTSFH